MNYFPTPSSTERSKLLLIRCDAYAYLPHTQFNPLPPPLSSRSSLEDTAGPRPLRTTEGVQRDTEPLVRMHRVENAAGPRAVHRREVLGREGLVAAQPKHSSELGYGRRDYPSSGVGEALSGAGYGGIRSAGPSDYAATCIFPPETLQPSVVTASSLSASTFTKSGCAADKTVWNVSRGLAFGGEEEQRYRAALVATRQPNRVFDTETPAIISTAVGDPWVRAARETRELMLVRAPRAELNRPTSFTATAHSFASMRATQAKNAEIAEVRRLN